MGKKGTKPSKVAALRVAREAQASLPAKVDAVTAMVDSIETVGDARTVARAATAMKELAKQAGLSLDEQNRASRAKLAAMRRGGAMLADLERGEAGRPPDNAPNAGRIISPYRETLAEAELTRGEASRWMRLAAFGDDEWAEVLGSCTDELTTGYVLRQWRREVKVDKPTENATAEAYDDLDALIATGQKFGTVYADPPWLYGNQGTRGATGDHYPGMAVADIAALPISEMVAPDAHLHLWTTNAFLFDAREVIEAWGFTYKSCFVWVKPQMGMGNYWRVSHEFCLLGVRGSAPFASRSEMSWSEWPRGKHSAKPERMYEAIERVSPGPRVELFARREREGWKSWGNGIESDLFSAKAS
jgi:N6-adenosine-specific RNA methylase IME4